VAPVSTLHTEHPHGKRAAAQQASMGHRWTPWTTVWQLNGHKESQAHTVTVEELAQPHNE
jgi:hypothetical protein